MQPNCHTCRGQLQPCAESGTGCQCSKSTVGGRFDVLDRLPRPDIAFIVHRLSQFLDSPSPDHWQAAKRVLRYLKGTQSFGINFDGNSELSGQPLLYTDSDFATCPTTRKSISGVVIVLNKGPVSWIPRKQGVVACSTTETEYVAAHDGAREAVWTRRIMADLGAQQQHPTPLFCDNAAARSLIENNILHSQNKNTIHNQIYFHSYYLPFIYTFSLLLIHHNN